MMSHNGNRIRAPKVTQYLSNPWKIASALDWRKRMGASILALRIERDSIGLAVSSHPSRYLMDEDDHDAMMNATTIRKLPPIRLEFVVGGSSSSNSNKKVVAPRIVEELEAAIRTHNVCGLVVHWPVRKEGRCGASCGRVMHILDGLVRGSETSSSSILTNNRQFCLWDSNHIKPMEEDFLGRCPVYGTQTLPQQSLHPSNQQSNEEQEQCGYYYSSHHQQEQNGSSSSSTSSSDRAVQTWKDFFRIFWPELFLYQEQQQKQHKVGHVGAYDYYHSRHNFKETCSKAFQESALCDVSQLDADDDIISYTKMAAF